MDGNRKRDTRRADDPPPADDDHFTVDDGAATVGHISVLSVLQDAFGVTVDAPLVAPAEGGEGGAGGEGAKGAKGEGGAGSGEAAAAGKEAPADAPPGKEKYKVGASIGEGGMGKVLKAFDVDLNRWVAMKVVRSESARRKEQLSRFVEEAQVIGQLEHPNVPPIYELGVNRENQTYFTMKLVKGRTLREIAKHLLVGRPEVRREFTPIRIAQILQQSAMGVHYANVRGVIHRDLKPENIMVGDCGEVLVMDWGLAKVMGRRETAPDGEEVVETLRSQSGVHTIAGVVQGTPAYMAPEQARGDLERIDPRTDVYGLGGVLYELLCYEPPHKADSLQAVLQRARAGEVAAPSRVVPPGTRIPTDLEAICMKALSPEMDDRHASALEFQQDLQAFIEGTRDRERRRSESLAMVAEGKKHMSAHRDLERRRDLLNEEARKVAKSVLPYEPVERKAELWNIEDAVANLERDASQEFSEARRLLDAAIQTDPDCHEARALLADLYWLKFQEAEAERNEQNTTFYRSLVEANDRGRYAVLLKGDGGLEVASEPPGAEAVLYRYREEGRILLPCDPQILGRTPLGPVSVPMGSYLLVLQHEGFRDTRYPLAIGRCERHSARVRLARDEEIGADFLHIPGGELIRGGDPESYGGHDRSKVHVDDFFIGRFPVTLGEYCEFLDALAAAGGDVSIHVPQQGEEKFAAPGPGGKYAPSATVIEEDPAAGGGPGREYYLKLPVFSVSWHSAMAFARWRSERDGREYTLPPEDAWEKAARGTDGRFYPWGDSFDWTFARGGLSRAGRNEPEPVGSFPADESPYGVRDLAGTIREWCADWFDEGAGTRVLRGGSWNLVVPHHFRAATRFGYRPAARTSTFGFRLYTREPLRGAAASAVTRKVSGTR